MNVKMDGLEVKIKMDVGHGIPPTVGFGAQAQVLVEHGVKLHELQARSMKCTIES